MLTAFSAWRLGVQNRAVLTGVQMAPAPLRLMIVQPAMLTAFSARSLLAGGVGDVNMHFARLLSQINRLNSPRTLDTQYRRVQLAILHGNILPDKAASAPAIHYKAGIPRYISPCCDRILHQTLVQH